MGTTCELNGAEEQNEREILWVTRPGHPIVKDIDDHFILEREEMYGEHFDVPEPMETLLISSFGGGEVFRSGITYERGAGRFFTSGRARELPTYHHPTVLKVIANACAGPRPRAGPRRKPTGTASSAGSSDH